VIAGNLANAQKTRHTSAGVYRRKMSSSKARWPTRSTPILPPTQVSVERVMDDPSPLPRSTLPGNPKADAQGMVSMPNVNPLDEMVDMMTASRSYQATPWQSPDRPQHVRAVAQDRGAISLT